MYVYVHNSIFVFSLSLTYTHALYSLSKTGSSAMFFYFCRFTFCLLKTLLTHTMLVAENLPYGHLHVSFLIYGVSHIPCLIETYELYRHICPLLGVTVYIKVVYEYNIYYILEYFIQLE